MKINVAVYGTLLSGFHNNYLLGKSTLVGKAQAMFPAVMFSAGGFPKLDLTKDLNLPPVSVEIYEVSLDTLEGPLDGLEGYPGWYDRTVMPFKLLDGEDVDAWIYHQEVSDLPVVETNDWRKQREKTQAV